MATLGALLLNFSPDLLDEIQEQVSERDFYKNGHKVIFHALISLYERGVGIDILTLTDELIAQGNLEKGGGAAYVAALTSRVPSTANAVTYAKIIKQNAIRRSLMNISNVLMENAHNESVDTRVVIEKTEQSLFDLGENHSENDLKPARTVIQITWENIEERAKHPGEYSGIPSGFEDLDKMTNGFQKSEMIIIGARPSIGKTALALSMTINMAVKKRIPCGFFTLEMSETTLMERILSSVGRVNSNKIRAAGLLKNTDLNKLSEAASLIYEAPLYLQDTPYIPLLDLRSLSRRMVRKHGIKIIFIDYITQVAPEDPAMPRHEQISHISRSLKALSRELDIPIVVLSQVGRQTEGKAPTLSDLRESGALEQDADLVIFLHRERNFNNEDESYENSRGIIRTELSVAKQRNGPTGSLSVAFIPEFACFENFTFER